MKAKELAQLISIAAPGTRVKVVGEIKPQEEQPNSAETGAILEAVARLLLADQKSVDEERNANRKLIEELTEAVRELKSAHERMAVEVRDVLMLPIEPIYVKGNLVGARRVEKLEK